MLARLAETLRDHYLVNENRQLRRELGEANSIIHAIRNGEIDAFLLSGELGDRAYVLNGADHIYRAIVEQMQEGYATLDADGTVLFCNQNLSEIIKTPLGNIIGTALYSLLKVHDQGLLKKFLKGLARDLSKLNSIYKPVMD